MEAVNLSAWSDEDLVARYQEDHSHAAWTELGHRHRRWRDALVRSLARKSRLSHADLEDALQDAALATQEAIEKFRTTRAGKPTQCAFRSYLQRVVTARFHDGCRRRLRSHKHLDRSGSAGACLQEGPPGPGRRHAVWQTAEHDDSLNLAQRHEAQALVRHARDQLTGLELRLCQALEREEPLTAVAREMGISHACARARLARVKETLRDQLRGLT